MPTNRPWLIPLALILAGIPLCCLVMKYYESLSITWVVVLLLTTAQGAQPWKRVRLNNSGVFDFKVALLAQLSVACGAGMAAAGLKLLLHYLFTRYGEVQVPTWLWLFVLLALLAIIPLVIFLNRE